MGNVLLTVGQGTHVARSAVELTTSTPAGCESQPASGTLWSLEMPQFKSARKVCSR
jgi:hypothetical protein